jgi:hypothetical protein
VERAAASPSWSSPIGGERRCRKDPHPSLSQGERGLPQKTLTPSLSQGERVNNAVPLSQGEGKGPSAKLGRVRGSGAA